MSLLPVLLRLLSPRRTVTLRRYFSITHHDLATAHTFRIGTGHKLQAFCATLVTATDIANQHGFFYGALLLARQGGDRLRLQKPDFSSFNVGELNLYADDTKELLEWILSDAGRVGHSV